MRFIVHSTLNAVQNLVFSNYLDMQSKNSTNNTLQKDWFPPPAPNKTHVNYILNNRWFCFQCTLDRRYAFCFAFKKKLGFEPEHLANWHMFRSFFCTSIFHILTLFHQPAFTNWFLPTAIVQNSIFNIFHPFSILFFLKVSFVYDLVIHVSIYSINTKFLKFQSKKSLLLSIVICMMHDWCNIYEARTALLTVLCRLCSKKKPRLKLRILRIIAACKYK